MVFRIQPIKHPQWHYEEERTRLPVHRNTVTLEKIWNQTNWDCRA